MLSFLIFFLMGQPAHAAFPLSIHGARARWISTQTLSYRPDPWLNLNQLKVEALQIESGARLPFAVERQQGPEWILHPAFSDLENWAREPYVLIVSDTAGNELDRTYFQLGGLLDGLYHYDGCLGVCFEKGKAILKVWAPTARKVSVVNENGTFPMERGPEGVWAGIGQSPYLYQVEVFTPIVGRVETQLATDPYSMAFSAKGETLVFDPEDPAYQPPGWGENRPALERRTDAVLYELHVREFSEDDDTVPDSARGKFKAFALQGTAGDHHLRDLAGAGITHIHLLPVSDFATVDEDAGSRREPRIPRGLPPDSPVPQEEIERVKALDSFNWGYDPVHYFAPEGSYASSPVGIARVKEFREMVQGLHSRGLRVVMDMVFNHTYGSGLSRESVLDKIVPGYYYRLDGDGMIRNSSCCSDTASERWMMEKLMRDSLESWRRHFHVDGFRFDLMNFHSVETMGRIRDYLREKDPSILLYGEAWNFGSLLETSPATAFVQGKAFGNEIGVFNDRIRDAIRGGTTDSKEKSDQGFATGLFYDFNHEPANRNTPIDLGAQRDKLLYLTDVIRMGMAGNLRDFGFRDRHGDLITGDSLSFHGFPTGFAKNPEETINYVSAHDGYTLFDALQAKLPFGGQWREPITPAERVDRQILSVGIIALSQGMPFFDSGIEILRSKSGDQNSYDSGDWFNRLDWSYQENGWGRGLPPTHSNPGDWPFWRPRLSDEGLAVGEAEILRMKKAFLDLLRLRKSSALFALPSAEEINRRVRFLETELGPMQPPGLILMEIRDDEGSVDENYRRILVGVNATNEPIVFNHDSFRGAAFERLYGAAEVRPRNASVRMPARSLSVWGEAR